MAEVIGWPGDVPVREGVRQALRTGRLVALPTESGYEGAAFALDANAVARLAALVGSEAPLTIALKAPIEIFDWLPYLRGAGLRLIREFWPGPLVLISALGTDAGLARHLPEATRALLLRHHGVPLRCID